ncbi:MAG: hypothetical protein ACLP0J_19830 [Solirubrobacteraceae bacterium]
MKPAAGGTTISNASPVLAALTDSEKAEILDTLIAEDATFAERAGREGRSVLARVEIVDVADVVADALLGLDVEELSRHAGRTGYGYVEPAEAAWLLLEAALQPWLDDIVRRAGLGFHSSAEKIGLGVLASLRQAEDSGGNDERLLSWAPDFTYEAGETGPAAARRSRHRANRGRRVRDLICGEPCSR